MNDMIPGSQIHQWIAQKLYLRIEELEEEIQTLKKPCRRHRLPNDRMGTTRKVVIGDRNVYLTTGKHEDGSLGEIFLKCGKSGKEGAVYDIVTLFLSIGIQYGIPLEVFIEKMKYQKMSDGGVTSDPDIPICDSVIDYIGKRLELDYGQNERTTDDNDQGMETTEKA